MMCDIIGCWNDAEYPMETEEGDQEFCEEHFINNKTKCEGIKC